MASNIKDFRKTLNDYYEENVVNGQDIDSDGDKVLRYAVAVKFIGEYTSVVLHRFAHPSPVASDGEHISSIFTIDLMKKMSENLDKVNEQETMDEKIAVLSEFLSNVNDPLYDMVSTMDVRIQYIEAVKSDFAIINEFLMNE